MLSVSIVYLSAVKYELAKYGLMAIDDFYLDIPLVAKQLFFDLKAAKLIKL